MARIHETEECREEGCLPRPGASAHQEGKACIDDGTQPGGPIGIERTHGDEIIQTEPTVVGYAKGNERTIPGNGWDHGVQARAVAQTGVDVGRGLIQPTSGERSEPLCQPGDRLAVREAHRRPLQPVTTIHPDVSGAIDEHIRDSGIEDERAQWPEAGEFIAESAHEIEKCLITQQHAFVTHRNGDARGVGHRRKAVRDKAAPHAIDQGSCHAARPGTSAARMSRELRRAVARGTR